MKDRIEAVLNELTRMRSEVFTNGSSEEVYTLLGRAMANLIKVRDQVK